MDSKGPQAIMRSSPRLKEKRVIFEVFDNPLLREEILKFAITGRNGKLDESTACNLRLVQKNWNEDVVRILWKARVPLYDLFPRNGKTLDDVIKTFALSGSGPTVPGNGRPPVAPPLCLTIHGDVFFKLNKNIERYSNCLETCGPALFELRTLIRDTGRPFTVPLAPHWPLSRLHKLDIILGLHLFEQRPIGYPLISSSLLKLIFSGATALAELDMFVSSFPFGEDDPVFESLTLPPTLTKMVLRVSVVTCEHFVEMFVRSPLPRLASLTLVEGKTARMATEPLGRILEKCRSSLKTLTIKGWRSGKTPENVLLIRFPVMEQLEEISITHLNAELEKGKASRDLENRLPKLRTLRLRYQTADMVRKWTEFSKFGSVTSLELLMAHDNALGEYVSTNKLLACVDAEVMKGANVAFPNLLTLEVYVSCRGDASGLKYIFNEMKRLTELKLQVFGNRCLRKTDVWDCRLTGVPAKMMRRSRQDRRRFLRTNKNVPSIKNLQELTSLSLKDYPDYYAKVVHGKSLISDFTFKHALLRMPKLKHLYFERPFSVSEEMAEKWTSRGRGRTLVYQWSRYQ